MHSIGSPPPPPRAPPPARPGPPPGRPPADRKRVRRDADPRSDARSRRRARPRLPRLVKGAPFRAIGGAVIADHGPIRLAEARRLSQFYAIEALHCRDQGSPDASALCGRRAQALREAVAAAEIW